MKQCSLATTCFTVWYLFNRTKFKSNPFIYFIFVKHFVREIFSKSIRDLFLVYNTNIDQSTPFLKFAHVTFLWKHPPAIPPSPSYIIPTCNHPVSKNTFYPSESWIEEMTLERNRLFNNYFNPFHFINSNKSTFFKYKLSGTLWLFNKSSHLINS